MTSPAPPQDDNVETVFDAVQNVLDEQLGVITTWSATDVRRFCVLAQSYIEAVTKKKRGRDEDDDAAGEGAAGLNGTTEHESDKVTGEEISEARLHSADRLFQSLERVRTQLKKLVPFGSVKETVFVPQSNPEFDTSIPAVDVDAFLYDERDLDELVEASLVSRSYCKECRSTNIGDVQFISHSFSRDQLVYMFCYALPWVVREHERRQSLSICDVGSRLGVVLAGAALLGKNPPRGKQRVERPLHFQTITGLEANAAFVETQRALLRKLNIAELATVTCIDAVSPDGLATMREHDIVVLHNVFEWFAAEEDQLAVWKKLRESLNKPGQILIVVPTLEQSMDHLIKNAKGSSEVLKIVGAADFIPSWVDRCNLEIPVHTFQAERLGDDHECGDDEDCEAHHDILNLVQLINIYTVKG
ncbi:Hypothetical protein, putative [Bodo saltans]|uniref:Methyltransferase n=1 Tax=Bodo saltans TaxID=75058 RepID=A0A0S4IWK0_BODSA|nr:Hypothetical protein, putative [Bodo saltans]|eukprot:CUG30024.1 Hypothetical protein, putative [Bodo saltans]